MHTTKPVVGGPEDKRKGRRDGRKKNNKKAHFNPKGEAVIELSSDSEDEPPPLPPAPPSPSFVCGFPNMNEEPAVGLMHHGDPLIDARYERTADGSLRHKDEEFVDEQVDSLNLSARYARDSRGWGVEQGIREFVQNWQDGALRTAHTICESSRRCFKHSDIMLVTETIGTTVRTTLYLNGDNNGQHEWVHPVHKIAWMERIARGDQGTLTLTNAGVTLPRRVLLFGHSDKPQGASGGFGEGLKFGISAVLGDRMNLEIRTGGDVWEFLTTGSVDAVHMHASRDPAAAANLLNTTVAITTRQDVPMTPVAFRRHVDNVFPRWFLYFRTPSNEVVYTEDGALLIAATDVKYIYVKGIMVMKYYFINEELEFGYNLLECDLPPTRNMLTREAMEAAKPKYAAIWSNAMKQKPDLVSRYADAMKRYMSSSDDAAGGSRTSDVNPGEQAALRLRDVPSKCVRPDLYQSEHGLELAAAKAVAQALISSKPGALFVGASTKAEVLLLITERLRKVVVCCCGPAEALLRDRGMLTNTDTIMEGFRTSMKNAPDVSGALAGTQRINYDRLTKEAPAILIEEQELKVVDLDDTIDVAYAGGKFCIRQELFGSKYAHAIRESEGCDGDGTGDCLCATMLMLKLLDKEVKLSLSASEIVKRNRERMANSPAEVIARRQRWQESIDLAARKHDERVALLTKEKNEAKAKYSDEIARIRSAAEDRLNSVRKEAELSVGLDKARAALEKLQLELGGAKLLVQDANKAVEDIVIKAREKTDAEETAETERINATHADKIAAIEARHDTTIKQLYAAYNAYKDAVPTS